METWSLSAKKDLRQYQWKAIKFSMATPRNALFLDMGLGKTAVTLHTIKGLMHQNALGGLPILIVAPIRVLHNVWAQEAAKWEHTRGLRFSIMHGSARKRLEAFNADVDVMLINPENLVWLADMLRANGYGTSKFEYDRNQYLRGEPRIYESDPARALTYPQHDGPVPDRLHPWPWSMLVVDESSMFKNSGTKRWTVLSKMAELFPRATLLTGTPTPNTMMELWAQMYLLDKGKRLGQRKLSFRDTYFYKADYMGYDWRLRNHVPARDPVTGRVDVVTGQEAINRRVRDVVMRLDAKDWLDMPEVLRNVVGVELPPDIMQQYNKFEDDMFMELLTSTVEAISAASLSQRCHQFANGAIYANDRDTTFKTWEPIHDAKLEALDEVLEGTGDNMMVAYQYKHDLERLRTRYNGTEGRPAARVLGSGMTQKETEATIADWNAGKIRMLLVHPAAVGHGLNLQHGGHTIVFFSLTWSLEQHDQLVARLHRSGQTDRVVVHYLTATNTVDELIYAALQSKARSQKELLDALREYSIKKEALRVTN